jgi:transposase-like protein
VYPVIFIDCVNARDRRRAGSRTADLRALAITVERTRDILGLWAGEHGDGEGFGCGCSRRSRVGAPPTA